VLISNDRIKKFLAAISIIEKDKPNFAILLAQLTASSIFTAPIQGMLRPLSDNVF
jgi:hypothetical protein